MQYKNPIPVVVGLVFVGQNKLVIIRRSIAPHIGELALPGGYVEEGDDWRAALQKEISQEAHIEVSTNPKHMVIYDVQSTPDTKKLLLFAKIGRAGIEEVREFTPTNETSERLICTVDYYKSVSLCFPLHQQVVEKFRSTITHEDQHPGGW